MTPWRTAAWLVACAAVIKAIALVASVAMANPLHVTPLAEPASELRFGLTLERRREIFAQVHAHEASARGAAEASFPNHDWSAHDDYGRRMWQVMTMVAADHKLDLAVVALIVDEGIRLHWTSPGRRPIDGGWVPLNPRVR